MDPPARGNKLTVTHACRGKKPICGARLARRRKYVEVSPSHLNHRLECRQCEEMVTFCHEYNYPGHDTITKEAHKLKRRYKHYHDGLGYKRPTCSCGWVGSGYAKYINDAAINEKLITQEFRHLRAARAYQDEQKDFMWLYR